MMNGWTKRKKKKGNNEKFNPAPSDIWVQFNQKWLCFKLKADMDQLAFKQIWSKLHAELEWLLVVPLHQQMNFP